MQETGVWSLGQEDPLEEEMELQYSCLENPMGRGAWQTIVHRVTKSWTWLSSWTCTHAQVMGINTRYLHPLRKPMQFLILSAGKGWRAQNEWRWLFARTQASEISSFLWLPKKMGREAALKSPDLFCSWYPDLRKIISWKCCLEFSNPFLPNHNVCLVSDKPFPLAL